MGTILFYIVSILFISYVPLSDAGGYDLPEIWKRIRADKSYHILFKLKMRDAPEQITLEEWASFDRHQFRLDMIYGDSRITYLTNGETNEIFRFSPFKCDLIESNSKDLGIIGNLFRGYSLNGPPNSARAYGMGPLWLRAMADATSVKLPPKLSEEDKNYKLLHEFDSYQLNFKFSPDEVAYDLRFSFKQDQQSFVEAVEWLDPTIKDQKKGTKQEPAKVEARAKVVWVDLNELTDAVFELPIGYGCKRKPDLEKKPDVGQSLDVLHQGGPNQAVFELTISKPVGQSLHGWDSHKYTVKMLRGGLKLNGSKQNSYYISQIQEQDPTTTRMRRTKRIWSFQEKTDEAAVYTIDIENKQCEMTHESARDSIRLTFPGQQNEINPIALNLEAITSLFNSNEDYHFIRETKSSSSSRVSDIYFEKRDSDYQITSIHESGRLAFKGPISIVKKLSTLTFMPESRQIQGFPPYQFSFHTKITLFFYSPDLTEILYKAVIDLLDTNEVDVSFMHKQLDVSLCFPDEKQEDIVIKYPLESDQLGKQLSVVQDLVIESFCLNLFTSTPIQPIQVTNVGLTYDNFFISIKMTLIDLPLTHFFKIQRGVRLSKGLNDTGIIEKVTSNPDRCAQACEHYHCFRFSFDKKTMRCALQIHPSADATQSSPFSELYVMESAWDKYTLDGLRSHLKPRQIVELFSELITSELNDKDTQVSMLWKDEEVPLTLTIDSDLLPSYKAGDPPFTILTPSSIESDMDSMFEMAKVETVVENSDKSETILHVNGDVSQIQIEYSLLLENKQFLTKKLAGLPLSKQAEAFSYDDCAHICEDNNCKSFAYCQSERSCSITSLHKTANIQSSVTQSVGCNVFILDYLSKFEDLGFVAKPLATQRIIKKVSLKDCALSCMEEEDFNCQGFYFANEEDDRCLLTDKHVEQFDSEPKFTFTTNSYKQPYRLYSRSTLAQFNEYVGKALELPEAEVAKTEIIEGFGAEFCASACIERSCLAFHICLKSNEDGTNLKQICQLAKQEVRKSHLVLRKRCTAFVLSDRSQFNRQNIKILQMSDKPDQAALDKSLKVPEIVINAEQKQAIKGDINEQLLNLISTRDRQDSIQDGSHWLAKAFSMFLGVLLGVCCVIVWREKESIRGYVSTFMSTLR